MMYRFHVKPGNAADLNFIEVFFLVFRSIIISVSVKTMPRMRKLSKLLGLLSVMILLYGCLKVMICRKN